MTEHSTQQCTQSADWNAILLLYITCQFLPTLLTLSARTGPVEASERRKKGVAAGSFIDLLCQQTDRSTGKVFSDFSIAAQALSLLGAGELCLMCSACRSIKGNTALHMHVIHACCRAVHADLARSSLPSVKAMMTVSPCRH